MHKFFCNYNNLTESYELSAQRSFPISRMSQIQAENTLLPKIKTLIQSLYENVVLLKEKEKDEEKLKVLDQTELMISNLYYSLFASPLELVGEKMEPNIANCKAIINQLISLINIPEYNRLCLLIKNNLDGI